ARKMLLGMDAGAICRVEEHGSGRRLAAERTVITHIGPDPTRPGLHLRQHRHSGVAGDVPLLRWHEAVEDRRGCHRDARRGYFIVLAAAVISAVTRRSTSWRNARSRSAAGRSALSEGRVSSGSLKVLGS